MKKFIAMLLAVSMVLTLAPLTGLAEDTRLRMWDTNSLTAESLPPNGEKDNTARGACSFSVAEGKGVAGEKAFEMKVETPSTNSGILNGTKGKTPWTDVSGFTQSNTVAADDVIWLYVNNQMGEDDYIVAEWVNGTTHTGITANTSSYVYTIIDDEENPGTPKIVKVSGGNQGAVNGIIAGAGTRGAVSMANGKRGWIGYPVGDVLSGKTITGLRLYTRTLSGNNAGIKGKSLYVSEMWQTKKTEMPALSDAVLLDIKSAAIKSAPSKLNYAKGDVIDPADGIITVTYGNDTTADIPMTAAMLSGFDSSEAGAKTVTASYAGITAGTFDVTVEDVSVSSIAIKTVPAKTSYFKGETLDLTGGVVTVTYSDTSTQDVDITADMVSGFDSTTVGTKTLTVAYAEKTTTFDITVAVYQQRFWDTNNLKPEPDSKYPNHNGGANRGKASFGPSSNGILGSTAFTMTVTEAGTDKGGMFNGTGSGKNWINEGVSGVSECRTIQDGDIFWVWVNNQFSQDCYICMSFFATDGSATANAQLATGKNPYTITADKDGNPAIAVVGQDGLIGSVGNTSFDTTKKTSNNRGSVYMKEGGQGWIGIPLSDVVGMVGKSIKGIYLYPRAVAVEGCGKIDDTLTFDEMWITEADVMPALTDAELLYSDIAVSSVAVKTAPEKLEYNLNEELVVTGGVITVTAPTGATYDVDMTADMITGFDSATAGTKALTVTYKGVTAAEGFSVEVTAAYLTDIAVKTAPKQAYYIGTALDVTGGVITATYSDSSTSDIDITADMVTGFDSSKAGVVTLTVTYLEKTAAFDVTVAAKKALIWDPENEEAGADFASPSSEGTNNAISIGKSADMGVGGKTALEIGIKTVAPASNRTNIAMLSTKPVTMDRTQIMNSGEIIWFYIDVKDDTTCKDLVFRVNNSILITGETLWSVKDDGTGKPVICPASENGFNLVTHNGEQKRIGFSNTSMSGWIGIPVNCLGTTVSNSGSGIGTKLDRIDFWRADTSKKFTTGDKVYIDEIWITSAGYMPDLTDAELLYTRASEPVLSEMSIDECADLTFNVYVKDYADGYKVRFTLGDGNPVIVSSHTTRNGLECFAFDKISAADIITDIKVELLDAEDSVIDTRVTSIAKYCGAAHEQNPSNEKLTAILANTLAYCDALNAYLGIDAPSAFEGMDWAASAVINAEKPATALTVSKAPESTSYVKGAGLWIFNIIKIYFNIISDATSETTVILTKSEGSAVTELYNDTLTDLILAGVVSEKNGAYVLFTDGIEASEYDTIYSVKILKNDAVVNELTYNVSTYLCNKWEDDTVSGLKELCRTFAGLGEAAKAYKE